MLYLLGLGNVWIETDFVLAKHPKAKFNYLIIFRNIFSCWNQTRDTCDIMKKNVTKPVFQFGCRWSYMCLFEFGLLGKDGNGELCLGVTVFIVQHHMSNFTVTCKASKRNLARQNKIALGPRVQTETSLKIEDLWSNKITCKLS
jgi:hypothetical protein